MLTEIAFRNFKVLRDTTLPLGRFTLIVGANGSGKSTALQSFSVASHRPCGHKQLVTAGMSGDVELNFRWTDQIDAEQANVVWAASGANPGKFVPRTARDWLQQTRVYHLNPAQISQSVELVPDIEFDPHGHGLAGVLDRIRDQEPERFDSLNLELSRWLPEFDRILFDVPKKGMRAIAIRTSTGHAIPASELSDGTLLALTLLTIAYLPDPPPLVGIEDPDRGLHPRLLREVRDALYRLSHPESFGETREPVQVIVTTHSPYLLDLYKDHPEEIVIAEKANGEAHFVRLVDHPQLDDILQDASLGEVWFSGVLGGVPAPP